MTALSGLWWTGYPTLAGMIGAVFYLGIFWAILSFILSIFMKYSPKYALFVFPIIVIFMETIRSYGRLGFPWQDLSYSQTLYTKLIQFAEFSGSRGVSLLVAILNVLILMFLISVINKEAKKSLISLIAILITLSVPYCYGFLRLRAKPYNEDRINVALLQGNVDPYIKWEKEFREKNMKIYSALTDSAAKLCPDLIVLPETATAGYWTKASTKFYELKSRSHEYEIPILAGTLDYDINNRMNYYNAAYFINPFGQDDIYRKIQLVPMSEQIPYQEKSNFLRKLDLGGSHFSRGDSAKVFSLRNVRFSVSICYESLSQIS
jgi:apolipoprotein N-acyltransferase